MNIAYLLLGSNLGSRESFIKQSKEYIIQLAGPVIKESSVYESEPWGTSVGQPFLNQVLVITTELLPDQLLRCAMMIENELGRSRNEVKNEPRTIDIDILFYNQEIIRMKQLKVPHERLHLRKFVLLPLAEISPDLIHPALEMSITELLDKCDDPLWVKKYEG